jgi:hypothetical protein
MPIRVILLLDAVPSGNLTAGVFEDTVLSRHSRGLPVFQKPESWSRLTTPHPEIFMAYLSSHQALQLAADFALTAEYVREAHASGLHTRPNLYEIASRAAFLKAHVIARAEETRPIFGESFRRAAYTVA